MCETYFAAESESMDSGSQGERLSRLEADLARLNRVSMMAELAASLAHEIKQPIAAVRLNAATGLRWLQHTPPDIEEAARALSSILRDITRAADIVDRNLSLYYRKGKPKRELVDVNEIILEAANLLKHEARRHSVSIRSELKPELPPVSADRVQLEQVLMNLILNGIEAMKAMAHREVLVSGRSIPGEITVHSKAAADGRILVSVSDAGIGLPAENAERVFEAFFTTKPQGTGMGLSISRRIIEAHGGSLWANPNPQRGATFHFMLPVETGFNPPMQTTLIARGRSMIA